MAKASLRKKETMPDELARAAALSVSIKDRSAPAQVMNERDMMRKIYRMRQALNAPKPCLKGFESENRAVVCKLFDSTKAPKREAPVRLDVLTGSVNALL